MTQTVPDISPLMPMHQDPLLDLSVFIIAQRLLLRLHFRGCPTSLDWLFNGGFQVYESLTVLFSCGEQRCNLDAVPAAYRISPIKHCQVAHTLKHIHHMHGWILCRYCATGWFWWISGLRAVTMWSSASFTKSLYWFDLQPPTVRTGPIVCRRHFCQ